MSKNVTKSSTKDRLLKLLYHKTIKYSIIIFYKRVGNFSFDRENVHAIQTFSVLHYTRISCHIIARDMLLIAHRFIVDESSDPFVDLPFKYENILTSPSHIVNR